MILSRKLREEWLGDPRAELLAGLVVALALIPETIAFSLIAGVDPKVGLYASFSIAVLTAIVGGRPGMISGATAATAVLMVKDHGLQYPLAATVLAGSIRIAVGAARARRVEEGGIPLGWRRRARSPRRRRSPRRHHDGAAACGTRVRSFATSGASRNELDAATQTLRSIEGPNRAARPA